ncbi:MAG: hypothetical protein DRQ48_10055, partial [Gammaproteobacteria bacterium]
MAISRDQEIANILAEQKADDTSTVQSEVIERTSYVDKSHNNPRYSKYSTIEATSSTSTISSDITGSTLADNIGVTNNINYEDNEISALEEAKELGSVITGGQDLSVGAMNPYGMQLKRMSHMDTGVVRRIISMIRDPIGQGEIFYSKDREIQIEGKDTPTNIYGINSERLKAGVAAFGSVIGNTINGKTVSGDVLQFATDLEKQLGQDFTAASTSSLDVGMAFSTITKTARSYSERGSIGDLNDITEEHQAKREEDLAFMVGHATNIAEMAAHKSVTGNERKRVVARGVQDIFMRSVLHNNKAYHMKDRETGLPMYNTETVPVLDSSGQVQLNSLGEPTYKEELVPAMQSTQVIMPDELSGHGHISSARWETGFSQRWSYFPEFREKNGNITGSYTETESKENYAELLENQKKFTSLLREQLVGNDGDEGLDWLREMVGGKKSEWQDTQKYLEEADVLGLDREGMEVDPSDIGMSNFDIAKYGKGQDKGGLYGDKALSETDRFKSLRMAGYSEEEAYLDIRGERSFTGIPEDILPEKSEPIVDILTRMRNSGASDRDIYLKRIELEAPPEQGTSEWLDLREGDLTGSRPISPKAKEKTLWNRAKELAGLKEPYVPIKTKGMSQGNEMEVFTNKDLVRFLTGNTENTYGNQRTMLTNTGEAVHGIVDSYGREVKTYSGIYSDKAYYEKGAFEGTGVSPDARIFDEKGKSIGLAEYKFRVKDKDLHTIKTQDRYQMQLQMYHTGEKQVHYYRQSESNKFAYDLIPADPKLQAKLINQQKQVLRYKKYLQGGGMPYAEEIISKENASASEGVFQEITASEDKATAFTEAVHNQVNPG